MTAPERAHLSVSEVAKHWHVSQATIRKLVRCGQLRAHRVGRALRVAPEEVERYEREQRADARS